MRMIEKVSWWKVSWGRSRQKHWGDMGGPEENALKVVTWVECKSAVHFQSVNP